MTDHIEPKMMTVKEMKTWLKDRNLSIKGTRRALEQRILNNRDKSVVDNDNDNDETNEESDVVMDTKSSESESDGIKMIDDEDDSDDKDDEDDSDDGESSQSDDVKMSTTGGEGKDDYDIEPKKMKVKEMKTWLQDRNLSIKGTRRALEQRILNNRDKSVVDNDNDNDETNEESDVVMDTRSSESESEGVKMVDDEDDSDDGESSQSDDVKMSTTGGEGKDDYDIEPKMMTVKEMKTWLQDRNLSVSGKRKQLEERILKEKNSTVASSTSNSKKKRKISSTRGTNDDQGISSRENSPQKKKRKRSYNDKQTKNQIDKLSPFSNQSANKRRRTMKEQLNEETTRNRSRSKKATTNIPGTGLMDDIVIDLSTSKSEKSSQKIQQLNNRSHQRKSFSNNRKNSSNRKSTGKRRELKRDLDFDMPTPSVPELRRDLFDVGVRNRRNGQNYREPPINEVKKRSRKKKKKAWRPNSSLFSTFSNAIIWFIFVVILIGCTYIIFPAERLPYCDSIQHNLKDIMLTNTLQPVNCRQCPVLTNGVCKNGIIICDKNFQIENEQCRPSELLQKVEQHVKKEFVSVLGWHAGYYDCDLLPSIYDHNNISEIISKQYLYGRNLTEENLWKIVHLHLKETYDHNVLNSAFKNVINFIMKGHIKSIQINKDKTFEALIPLIPFRCYVFNILELYWYYILAVIIIFLLFWKIWRKYRRKKVMNDVIEEIFERLESKADRALNTGDNIIAIDHIKRHMKKYGLNKNEWNNVIKNIGKDPCVNEIQTIIDGTTRRCWIYCDTTKHHTPLKYSSQSNNNIPHTSATEFF